MRVETPPIEVALLVPCDECRALATRIVVAGRHRMFLCNACARALYVALGEKLKGEEDERDSEDGRDAKTG
jgi:hypothetical protein